MSNDTQQTLGDPAQAFRIAKEAFAYMARFNTPPFPEIYEVWYRFVEGKTPAITQPLDHAIEGEGRVTLTRLLELRDQFLLPTEGVATNQAITSKLSGESRELHKLVEEQQGAVKRFDGSIEDAKRSISATSLSKEEFDKTLTDVLESSQYLQQQSADFRDRLARSLQQIDQLQEQLRQQEEKIFKDPLTGVGNRRAFDEAIQVANSDRSENGHLYMFLIDLDNFKKINDEQGHPRGDLLLQAVASALVTLVPTGKVTRFGGDEFAIIVSIAPEEAVDLASEICDHIKTIELPPIAFSEESSGSRIRKVSISAGAALLRPDDNSTTWFERADKLLYDAKLGGRNRAMVERKRS